jgi:hypothetical protein
LLCSAKTASVDEHGDPTDGCIPYTYDAKANALTLDGQEATLSTDRAALTLGEDDYDLAPIPPAGSRWALSLKGIHIGGFWPNLIVHETFLTMAADGQFAATSSTFGSFGGLPGTPGSGNFAVVPPDQRGTYAVDGSGVLTLTYADGHTKANTISIVRDVKTGSADPAEVGFLIGDTQYFKPGPDDS